MSSEKSTNHIAPFGEIVPANCASDYMEDATEQNQSDDCLRWKSNVEKIGFLAGYKAYMEKTRLVDRTEFKAEEAWEEYTERKKGNRQ